MCQTVFKINDTADTTRYWILGKGTAISKIHSITTKQNFVSKANSTPRYKHHQNGYSQWPQWNTCPSRFPAEYIQESSHDWHFMYYLKYGLHRFQLPTTKLKAISVIHTAKL